MGRTDESGPHRSAGRSGRRTPSGTPPNRGRPSPSRRTTRKQHDRTRRSLLSRTARSESGQGGDRSRPEKAPDPCRLGPVDPVLGGHLHEPVAKQLGGASAADSLLGQHHRRVHRRHGDLPATTHDRPLEQRPRRHVREVSARPSHQHSEVPRHDSLVQLHVAQCPPVGLRTASCHTTPRPDAPVGLRRRTTPKLTWLWRWFRSQGDRSRRQRRVIGRWRCVWLRPRAGSGRRSRPRRPLAGSRRCPSRCGAGTPTSRRRAPAWSASARTA